MNKFVRNLIQILLVLVPAFFLFRIFPVFLFFLESAALSIRSFWWVILLMGLMAWVYWVLKKRN